jgi:hypothetical protein
VAYFEKEENGFPVFLPHEHADNLMKLSPIVFQDKGLEFFRKKPQVTSAEFLLKFFMMEFKNKMG